MCAFIIENWLTVVSIILSGLISLWVSAAYYRKGNRNNLQMTVIYPIISLLRDSYSRKNYQLLNELSKNYCIRYMKKSEQKVLTSLLLSYKEVSQYDSDSVTADILRSYFEYTLRKNGIDPMPVPFEYEGEIVYYDYPPDMNYLVYDLERVVHRDEFDYELSESENAIISIFNHYCKDSYGIQKSLPFFIDYRLPEVLTKSEIKKKWDERFEEVDKAKESFLNMKVAKRLMNK